MARYAHNKAPAAIKRRYFELIRSGLSGSAAAQRVGVSLSCGSLWFIDAGSVNFVERTISPRYLSQDDRIEIADGLARNESVKIIAARIGKSVFEKRRTPACAVEGVPVSAGPTALRGRSWCTVPLIVVYRDCGDLARPAWRLTSTAVEVSD